MWRECLGNLPSLSPSPCRPAPCDWMYRRGYKLPRRHVPPQQEAAGVQTASHGPKSQSPPRQHRPKTKQKQQLPCASARFKVALFRLSPECNENSDPENTDPPRPSFPTRLLAPVSAANHRTASPSPPSPPPPPPLCSRAPWPRRPLRSRWESPRPPPPPPPPRPPRRHRRR